MSRSTAAAPSVRVAERATGLDWRRIAGDLDAHGCAVLSALLSADECAALAATYDADARFRSRVVMARHGFGRGEYKYFAHPLPEVIDELRRELYPPLAGIANAWNAALGIGVRYPDALADFLARCHRAGQRQPTPLLLRYGGGEFVLTEQRPRMQSRVEVVPLAQGDGVIFPVRHRPVRGGRGAYRVTLRHGVSRLRWGRRYTAGVIFHDA